MKIYIVGEPRYLYIIQLTVHIEHFSKLKIKQNNVSIVILVIKVLSLCSSIYLL